MGARGVLNGQARRRLRASRREHEADVSTRTKRKRKRKKGVVLGMAGGGRLICVLKVPGGRNELGPQEARVHMSEFLRKTGHV